MVTTSKDRVTEEAEQKPSYAGTCRLESNKKRSSVRGLDLLKWIYLRFL